MSTIPIIIACLIIANISITHRINLIMQIIITASFKVSLITFQLAIIHGAQMGITTQIILMDH
jgi:hypothetical protein